MQKHKIRKSHIRSSKNKKQRKKIIGHVQGYVTIVLLTLAVLGFVLAGGLSTFKTKHIDTNKYILVTPQPYGGKASLELHTLSFITLAPTTPPAVSLGHSCQNSQYNDEPEILAGSDPGPGNTVGSGGKIRVWVFDEGGPHIAPGEVVNSTTGDITQQGNLSARDGRSKHYIWEPAIYITPLTSANINGPFSGDAENGGKPYFPSLIKGDYNNNPNSEKKCGSKGPSIDSDYVNFKNGPKSNSGEKGDTQCKAEYIWNVNTLGLSSGSYRAQFVIHDGDDNLAIDCISIQI